MKDKETKEKEIAYYQIQNILLEHESIIRQELEGKTGNAHEITQALQTTLEQIGCTILWQAITNEKKD